MWQNEIYLVLKLIGQRVYCQPHTSMGRADCVIETGEYIYILEFKLDQPAKKALEQINEKGYATPYQADKRRIYKIGISFSVKKRNIDDWEIEET